MPATVVLGAQWGDEGKGKLVDILAGDASLVARFQGGNNAGHTVVLGDNVLKFHLLPSGITREDCELILGDGMVIDPWVLDKELTEWSEKSNEMPSGNRLFISERAHVILPFHRALDSLDKKIGTTGRGIGPTYSDKISRTGIRFGDIISLLEDENSIEEIVKKQNILLVANGSTVVISAKELKEELEWINTRFGNAITNTSIRIENNLKMGELIVLEGAQGCLLDIDQGTYPYVTSSVTSRGNATHGVGIHPGHVDRVIGIVKAYTTRVGHGPFTTELEDEIGEHLTEIGHEYGTTTGRRRRCGWLDAVVLKHSHRVNGFTEFAMTKLDVLGGLDKLKICIGYDYNGEQLTHLPTSSLVLEKCKPVYIEMDGFEGYPLEQWLDIAKDANENNKGFSALPENAQKYIQQVEALLGVKVSSVGVGPDRDATIIATN